MGWIFSSKDNSNDLEYCQRLAANLTDATDLPKKCRDYPDVVDLVMKKKHEADAEAIAFQGMDANAAIQARKSRSLGVESPAKLQRRLTRTGSHHKD